MIDTVYFDYQKKELNALHQLSLQLSFKVSEDDWSFQLFSDSDEMVKFIEKQLVDFSLIDVTKKDGLLIAEKTRKQNPDSLMMIIADESVSPLSYLNPSILPSSLLMRPISKKQAVGGLTDLFKIITSKDNGQEEQFQLTFNGNRKFISYSQIFYFEARDKKIILNTGNQEFEFYDTIENLEERLPSGFIRCHRSFIVSKSKIESVFISKNTIELTNGLSVPLSRSYKSVFKEFK